MDKESIATYFKKIRFKYTCPYHQKGGINLYEKDPVNADLLRTLITWVMDKDPNVHFYYLHWKCLNPYLVNYEKHCLIEQQLTSFESIDYECTPYYSILNLAVIEGGLNLQRYYKLVPEATEKDNQHVNTFKRRKVAGLKRRWVNNPEYRTQRRRLSDRLLQKLLIRAKVDR